MQCYSCGNPETVIKIRKRTECIELKCKACGFVRWEQRRRRAVARASRLVRTQRRLPCCKSWHHLCLCRCAQPTDSLHKASLWGSGRPAICIEARPMVP